MSSPEGPKPLEKKGPLKSDSESQKITSAKELDDFYQDTEKKIVEIAGPDEGKKDSPSNLLLDFLRSRINALKEKMKDALGDQQEEINALKLEMQNLLAKFMNRRDLQKLLGRAAPPDDIPAGEKQEFQFKPDGANGMVSMVVNDLFQIENVTIDGHSVRFEKPAAVSDFQKIQARMKRVWERIAGIDPPVPSDTEVVAEDLCRFRFRAKDADNKDVDYKIISDGMNGVSLYQVNPNPGKNSEPGTTALIDEKGQQVIESHSQNGFTLDLFTKTGMALGTQRFEDGLCVEETTTASAGRSRIERSLTPDGHILVRTYLPQSEDPDMDLRLTEIRTLMPNGDLVEFRKLDHGKVRVLTLSGPPQNTTYFGSPSEKPLFRVEHGTDKPITFIGTDGTQVSDFNTERKKNPNLTPDGYMTLLSRVIQTPEQWEAFTEQFMQYVWDSPDPNNPFVPGSEDKHADYWQTPEETVARLEGGHTLGDCDDYAFLIQALLEKQGKKSFVVGVPGHALCTWVEKRPDGRYDAYSICTYGYDKNGNRAQNAADAQKEAGYASPEEAMNAIFVKYQKPGKGVTEGFNYRVQDGYVQVLSIPSQGEQGREMVKVEDLVVNP